MSLFATTINRLIYYSVGPALLAVPYLGVMATGWRPSTPIFAVLLCVAAGVVERSRRRLNARRP